MTTHAPAEFEARLAQARSTCDRLRSALATTIVGQEDVVDQVLWALVAGGHVLLEGQPGLGKTLLVRSLAAALKLEFARIQFTPDLMPSDVTGTNVLVMPGGGTGSAGRFELQRGPIFAQLVLADEINRATPKTQSALLEAMQEHAVTIAGVRHPLKRPFFVLATQNPIEMEGTYPLPEAQLDRFLLKVLVPSPAEDVLTEILGRTTGHDPPMPEPVLDSGELSALASSCRDVVVAEPVLRYAARLVGASDPAQAPASALVRRSVRCGAGVRGAQSLILAAKAVALLEGRPHVAFADVQRVAKPVLRHRILLNFEAEAEGISTHDLIDGLLENVATRPKAVEQVVGGT